MDRGRPAGLPEDGQRQELVEGSLVVSPPPGSYVQAGVARGGERLELSEPFPVSLDLAVLERR